MKMCQIGLTLLVIVGIAAAQTDVLLEQSEFWTQKAILMRPTEFREAELVKLSKRFLAEHSREVLAKLLFVVEKEDAWSLKGGGHERSYISWALDYFRTDWRTRDMAEVVRIGNDAVLRVRYGDRQLSRVVLTGKDPLQMTRAEILYIRLPHSPLNTRHPIAPRFHVRTSGEFTEALCASIVEELRAKVGLESGMVSVRHDPWFITSETMPVQYSFWPAERAPGPVEFIETPTGLSGWEAGTPEIQCSLVYPTRPPKYCADALNPERK
jgi:hypothetical protein